MLLKVCLRVGLRLGDQPPRRHVSFPTWETDGQHVECCIAISCAKLMNLRSQASELELQSVFGGKLLKLGLLVRAPVQDEVHLRGQVPEVSEEVRALLLLSLAIHSRALATPSARKFK